MKVFREYGDKAGAEVIGSSCIACLAHLAVLYEVVGRVDPLAGNAGDLCDSALQRLGNLTSDLGFDEYTYLDLPLGVRPSLRRFLTAVIQTGDWDRTLGGNRYQFSTPALQVSRWKKVYRCGISGGSSGKCIPIFWRRFLTPCHRYSLWLRWRTVPRRIQSIQVYCRPR